MSPMNERRLVFAALALSWIVIGVSCSKFAHAEYARHEYAAKDEILAAASEVSFGSATFECTEAVESLAYLTDETPSHGWVKLAKKDLKIFEKECQSSLRAEQKSETAEKIQTAKILLDKVDHEVTE